jgi:hypothetical protein
MAMPHKASAGGSFRREILFSAASGVTAGERPGSGRDQRVHDNNALILANLPFMP